MLRKAREPSCKRECMPELPPPPPDNTAAKQWRTLDNVTPVPEAVSTPPTCIRSRVLPSVNVATHSLDSVFHSLHCLLALLVKNWQRGATQREVSLHTVPQPQPRATSTTYLRAVGREGDCVDARCAVSTVQGDDTLAVLRTHIPINAP